VGTGPGEKGSGDRTGALPSSRLPVQPRFYPDAS
jgi:hypothetical protein